ncbi:MAG: hypothetical protein VW258_09870 [Thalassolituus sp.]
MKNPVSTAITAEAAVFLEQADPQAFQVYKLANGARNVAEIAETLSLSEADTWAALDRLADLDALVSRATPPSATPHPSLINRREAMGKMMMGALGAAALMSAPQVFAAAEVALPKAAAAGQEMAKGRQEQAKKQQNEQQSKQMEMKKGIMEQKEKRKATEAKSKQVR